MKKKNQKLNKYSINIQSITQCLFQQQCFLENESFFKKHFL